MNASSGNNSVLVGCRYDSKLGHVVKYLIVDGYDRLAAVFFGNACKLLIGLTEYIDIYPELIRIWFRESFGLQLKV
jgi:hypothetical protein